MSRRPLARALRLLSAARLPVGVRIHTLPQIHKVAIAFGVTLFPLCSTTHGITAESFSTGPRRAPPPTHAEERVPSAHLLRYVLVGLFHRLSHAIARTRTHCCGLAMNSQPQLPCVCLEFTLFCLQPLRPLFHVQSVCAVPEATVLLPETHCQNVETRLSTVASEPLGPLRPKFENHERRDYRPLRSTYSFLNASISFTCAGVDSQSCCVSAGITE